MSHAEQLRGSIKFMTKNAACRARKFNKRLRNRQQRRTPVDQIPTKEIKGWVM